MRALGCAVLVALGLLTVAGCGGGGGGSSSSDRESMLHQRERQRVFLQLPKGAMFWDTGNPVVAEQWRAALEDVFDRELVDLQLITG